MTHPFLTLLILSRLAAAHGIDAHRVQVELDGAVVRVAVTPGVDAFPGADQNGDAILDRAEVAAARSTIRARVESALHLEGADGEAPTCEPASISTVGDGAGHVRASLRCTFPSPPGALSVRLDALGWLPYTLEAVRTRQEAPGRWAPDGEVMGGTFPARGGVVTLLARGPENTPPPTTPDPTARISWTDAPIGRAGVVLALAVTVSALVHAWRRGSDTRRPARRAGSPSHTPTETLPTTRGPPR